MQAKADYEGKTLITKDERCEIDLGLLEKFDAFARENGLTYWLFWGTLLGAVRHKGFIPWDDDIDIAMPQHDYLRLVELLRQNPTAIRDAYLNAFEIDRGYARPFAKLCDSRTILFEDFDLSYVDAVSYTHLCTPMERSPENPTAWCWNSLITENYTSTIRGSAAKLAEISIRD